MKKDSLGDRIKGYEKINKNYLIPKIPTIIRLDGKAFHTFTKGFEKPFDVDLINTMNETAKVLCQNIMGAKIAYVQSDEISLFLSDYDNIHTQPWFGGNIQKIVSVSASIATVAFNNALIKNLNNSGKNELVKEKSFKAMFDSRVFQLPKDEVVNYFIWRQNDCVRNSINSVAQKFFSHRELHNKNCNEMQEMLFSKHGINWNNLDIDRKRGRVIRKKHFISDNNAERSKWIVDNHIPKFTEDRRYIEYYV